MFKSVTPFPNLRPVCPCDALPDPLKEAVLYAIVNKGVPPAIALIDALAAAAAVIHCGHDCVTPDGEPMPATLFTLCAAPSISGKGTSYRIFFKHFTQTLRRYKADFAKPRRLKSNTLEATLNDRAPAPSSRHGVEMLLSEMTYFSLLKALDGEGRNVAIQDEDAASFFDSELFKRHSNRLTQVWSGDPPLSKAYGNSQLDAVDARLSIGLRTQPGIQSEVPEAILRKAIKIGLFPRFLVGCHDPKQSPWNESYHADPRGEFSDREFQARLASLAFMTNARNSEGFAGRVPVELDTDANAFMLELSFRAKQWLDTDFADIREAAGRAWENTLRVAVVLHVFCLGEGKVSRDYVERAWAIVEWSLSQHRLIFVESLGLTQSTAMPVQATPIRQVRVAQSKPSKVPRPLQDAQWLLYCLGRLSLPARPVTVHELNQLALLPPLRLKGALKWLELEGTVRLIAHGKDSLIMPIISTYPAALFGSAKL